MATVYTFQSTLSVRRATVLFGVPFLRLLISIHALREESDVLAQAIEVANQISIHALREESDANR